MKLIKYSILILLWFPVITCAQYRILEKQTFIKQIIGKWDWRSTYGGIGGRWITPDEAGYNKSFVLFQDSADRVCDSISYYVYINDSLSDWGTTFISLTWTYCDPDSTWSINAKILGPEYTVFLGNYVLILQNTDSMRICERCMDCFYHTYLKDLNYPVNISDTRFLYALIHEGVDTDADSLISYSEAKEITTLDVSGREISDMTGIEAFINLDSLDCSNNKISVLDMSLNHKISFLNCSENQINKLIFSKLMSPSWLDCSNNLLASLDLPGKPGPTENSYYMIYLRNIPTLYKVCLWKIPSSDPKIITDIAGSPNVFFTNDCVDQIINIPDKMFLNALIDQGVDLNGDSLISYGEAALKNGLGFYNKNIVDLTGIEAFINLTELSCDHNNLTYLDVSSCKGLIKLRCSYNQLNHLNVSNCIALRDLRCNDNELTSLNVSNNTALTFLDCGNNNLQEVCVWIIPFPPQGVDVHANPNIYFTTACSEPEIYFIDTSHDAQFIEVSSTEDGIIYLVPENTSKNITTIRMSCLDSVAVIAHSAVSIPLSGLENGIYWLFARDSIGNISEFKAFNVISGGIHHNTDDQIKIFPNPAKEQITIRTNNSEIYFVEITSINGQEIFYGSFTGSLFQIDISYFLKGVYVITVKTDESILYKKIIVN
jgi:hypothetical protein